MATSPYYSLIGYFPVAEAPEVTELLDALELVAEYEDVWKLAKAAPGALGTVIQGFTNDHFEATWDPIAAQANELTTGFTPLDPMNPTAEELLVINGLMTQMRAAFHPLKTPVIERAVADVGGAGNDWEKLHEVAQTDATGAAALVSNDWYQYLASYYAAMSHGYIRLASREYFFLGRVLDDLDDAPVRGVRVHCKDINLASTERSFGFTTTNREGYFKTRFTVLDGVEVPPYTLRFTFFHELLGAGGVVRDLDFDPGEQEPIVEKLLFDTRASDSSLIASTGIAIPADVQTYLTANSIVVSTLEDIRHLGGFKNLPTDTIDKNDPDLLKLDGLASLEIVQPDVAKNDALYDRGYTGITEIALTQQGVFVEENSDLLGDYGAGQVQYMAKAGHLFGLNHLAISLTPAPQHVGHTPFTTGGANNCDCPDCKSAVSPLAYLADLIVFARRNLRLGDPSAMVDIGLLEEHLHQRLGDIKVDCGQLKGKLCQNRVAAEVLRSNLDAFPPDTGPAETLAAAEKDHLMRTYDLLLTKLGTSYTEVRTLRGEEDEEERQRVAHRLGIVLQDPGEVEPDTLKHLFLDLSNEANISEPILESLFGLRDTSRDVFEPTPESDVERWKKLRLRQIWEEQHALKNRFWDTGAADREVIIDPDVVTVDDLRDPVPANNAFKLWKKRKEWCDHILPFELEVVEVPLIDHRAIDNVLILYFDGTPFEAEDLEPFEPETILTYEIENEFTAEYTVVTAQLVNGNIEIQVEEEFEVDRGGGTITWGPPGSEEDHENVVTRTILAPNLVTIFDLMLTGDVSYPPEGNPSVVLAPEWGTFLPGGSGDVPTLFAYLTERADAVRTGEESAIEDLYSDLHLLPEELLWLVDHISTYQGYPLDVYADNNHDVASWLEMRSILVNVFKRLAEDLWRTEENGLSIALAPSDFWVSVVAPKIGPWPIADPVTPLIEPDLIGVKDLPEITARERNLFSLPEIQAGGDVIAPEMVNTHALAVLEARKLVLTEVRENLELEYDSSGFMALLDLAFNAPEWTWNETEDTTGYLETQALLASATHREAAEQMIAEVLKITADEFIFLVETGKKHFEGPPLPEHDHNRLMGILTGAYKRIVLYPAWLAQEYDENTLVTEVQGVDVQQQWKLRKAALPKWGASQERRNAWVMALAEHSERPIIDADLIGPDDMVPDWDENRAHELWLQRGSEMETKLAQLATGDGALVDLEDLDDLVKAELGFEELDLESIRESAEAGIDIRPRLAQLTLSSAGFNQLMTCRDILAADPGNVLTEEEKTGVRHILAQVWKRRRSLIHRLEEVAPVQPDPPEPPIPVVTLSQDFFQIPENPIVSFPPTTTYDLKPWLAEERDLILWRRQLKGRIEQEKSAMDAWQETLFEVDDAMMVHLRDAMVTAAGDPDRSLIENARDLGDALLIDLENNCCYKTNRVAVAIESLQQLIWKTRTGDILQHYPTMKYVGGDFDEAWTWMGSYANWRAAMFVFLYPENVLHPSLRRGGSEAFQRVVDATRDNRRFGPSGACELAHEFEQYLQDIASLEVACAQQAITFEGPGGCGAPYNAGRKLTYLFAKAGNSGKLYYTVSDTNDPATPVQRHAWNAIPIPSGTDYVIHGCDRYINNYHGIDHIFLFVTDRKSTEKNKFFAMRYALQHMRWEDGDPTEFEVSNDDLHVHDYVHLPDLDKFDTSIRALCVLKNSEAWQSPSIAVTISDEAGDPWTFARSLDPKAEGYNGPEDWHKWITSHDLLNDQKRLNGTILDFWYYQPPQPPNGWDQSQVMHFYLVRYVLSNGSHQTRVIRRRHQGANAYVRIIQSTSLERLMVYAPTDTITPRLLGFWYDWEDLRVMAFDEDAFDHPEGDPIGVESIEPLGNPRAQFISVNPDHRFVNDLPVGVLQDDLGYGWDRSIQLVPILPGDPNPGTLGWEDPIIQLLPRFSVQPRIGPAGSETDQTIQREVNEVVWYQNQLGNDRLVEPLEEATYFVPMQIALRLQANGHYQAAMDWFRSVYDHIRSLPTRKISYLLRQEEELGFNNVRLANWYKDPLHPHAIAALRRHTYTRYTILCIIQCLLDHADAEYTTDTSETVPRARELYEDALQLLKLLVPAPGCPMDEATGFITEHEVPKEWVGTWTTVLQKMEPLAKTSGFGDLVSSIGAIMAGTDPMPEQLAAVIALIDAALEAHETQTIAGLLGGHETLLNAVTAAALGSAEADAAIIMLVQQGYQAFAQTMTTVTGLPTAELENESIPWLIDGQETSPFDHGYAKEYIMPGKGQVVQDLMKDLPAKGFQISDPFPNIWLSGVTFSFCVVPNPIAKALVMKAEVELWKIHNCMNIAGMVRELDPFSAPTDSTTGIPVIGAGGGSLAVPNARSIPPSAYRYRLLVDRARQLVGMAQQVEAAFLSTLEKLDAERYSQLRAEQDIATSKATIKLQDLKVNEANSGMTLAEMQKHRSTIQANGLRGMIAEGLNVYEEQSIHQIQLIATYSVMMDAYNTAFQASQLSVLVAGAGGGATAGFSVGAAGLAAVAGYTSIALQGAASMILTGLNSDLQVNQIRASFERRKQEWEYQLSLAVQDEIIGNQQIKLAKDRVRIVGQERAIAVLQNEHAQATLDFLKNKFTSAELYEWMSQVLEDAYAWFLQEATAMAILAQRQLAFERQIDLPPFVRTDYWVVDGGSMGGVDMTGQGAVDRRGLTGSTRLLKDLSELDQYAFNTNSPKLQLSKTISLNEIAPEELMALRDRSIANFRTTHEYFDRDYPGHYLRLIKKVSVTVIALNPPTKGIRATLTNGGVSRVYTGGIIFQERVINRYPEQIALSGGVSDYGVFQLHGEGEFLNPFEGTGVDTQWELRMEKAANPFDFGSIADVLITIEYEAMNSFLWRNTVVQRLNSEPATAALAISMKNNLPDQWFDLHNVEQTETPYKVSFQINQRDLVPNISDPAITAVTVYFSMKDNAEFSSEVTLGLGQVLFQATPNDNLISTRANAQGFGALVGEHSPVNTWSFGLEYNQHTQDLLAENKIDDIFIIFSYDGDGAQYSF